MTLLEECIEALGESGKVLTNDDSKKMFQKFSDRFPFTEWGRIDQSKINTVKIDDVNSLHEVFKHNQCIVFWDEASLPVLTTSLSMFMKEIDEVLAVSFDTWIVNEDFTEIVEFYHDGDINYGATNQ